jgi:hypothetical protein
LIINNAPQHEAVMSNVNEIGEFRIRNSAKAFNILSSGLYANKIRAIIRELSCNAVDSHVAAGRADVPFDVHLPNTIDPTFRIRDYGTGLSHEQVINIYTTYFESTKTESNQFIGALGLGSKSPFSYTDNFTVTAIKDGRRNVYSAFINGEGVPSIALMHGEDTDEPNGVEIQFAVTDRWDFDKFRSEARQVYTYFKLRPVVSGGENEFTFVELQYKDRNIIPGVHYRDGSRGSIAVMGNIAYPIEVPNADTNLGSLAALLNCNLEMHFDIGELDFQASREGLSYIPSTIEAIKNKLIALNAQLAVHLALEADAIPNAWDKAYFVLTKSRESLWREAAGVYMAANPDLLIENRGGYHLSARDMRIEPKDLAARFNIEVLAFYKSFHNHSCNDVRTTRKYHDRTCATWDEEWTFSVDRGTMFVVNDTKKGALARAKYHWRHAKDLKNSPHTVYVLSAATKGHAMDLAGFYAELQEPPESQRMLASALLMKERKVSDKTKAENVRILRLDRSDEWRRRSEVVWKEAGQASEYNSNTTYYYVPLSGYTPLNVKVDPHTLYDRVKRSGVTGIKDLTIYGVRKSDIEWVRSQKNWVLAESYIADVLSTMTPEALASLAVYELDNSRVFGYNTAIASLISNPQSPYLRMVQKLKGIAKNSSFNRSDLEYLLRAYAPGVDYNAVAEQLKAETVAVRNRYSLLSSIRDYDINEIAVAEYINLIDNTKGI